MATRRTCPCGKCAAFFRTASTLAADARPGWLKGHRQEFLAFLGHNPRVAQRLGMRASPRFAADGEAGEGIDPNDLPAWPIELPERDQLRNALAEHLYDADVERALAVVAGDLNDDPDVRQELDPLNRLLTWLRDIKGIGSEAIAEIEALLTVAGGLSDVGAAVFEGAADGGGQFLRGMPKRGDRQMSYMDLRRAEAETGIDILAFDAEPSAAQIYKRALTELGYDHAGITDVKALRIMLRMARQRQASADGFAADAASFSGGSQRNDDWLKAFGVSV